MDDLGKVLSGAVLQGLFDYAKNRRKKQNEKEDGGSPESGGSLKSALKLILMIAGAAAAAAGVVYLIYRFLKPDDDRHYSFLPFGHRDEDDADEDDYEDDPEIVKDLEQSEKG